jgi:hypothetical protein
MADHVERSASLMGRVKIALYRGLKVGYTTETHTVYWMGLFGGLSTLIKKGNEAEVSDRLEKLNADITVLETTVRDAELQYYFREAVPASVAGPGRRRERKYS